MDQIYFNPLDSTTNYIGTNPLSSTGVPIKTSYATLLNPSLYEAYTFFPFFSSFPSTFQTYYQTSLLAVDGYLNPFQIGSGTATFSNIVGTATYRTAQTYFTYQSYETWFSNFQTNYAASYRIEPVVYSVRFGTELQTLYASTAGASIIDNIYESIFFIQEVHYEQIVYTYVDGRIEGDNTLPSFTTLQSSNLFGSGIYTSSTKIEPDGVVAIGSSSFVNMLGSNVYPSLLDTTNSVIIYNNEQVSTYYSQSLSYQVNISNLTAALNSVSGGNPANKGDGTIPVTVFSWIWESTPTGWTGSQFTNFNGYIFSTVVNSYLFYTYNTTISNSSVAVTEVQSLITTQNNDLSNAQTFLNNAVTTLQSQVSLAGQIISSLTSGMQTIINNIS